MKQICVIVLFLIGQVISDEVKKGCPEPNYVCPCKCTNSPFTNLECQHIQSAETLRKVAFWSSGYEFKELHIKYSVLQYLPRDMFEKVNVKALYLKNVTLCQLFDLQPEGLEMLDTLHIEATQLMSGLMEWFLQPMTHLRILNVYFNNVPVLGPEHTYYLSKSIQQISLYDTSTYLIRPGTFNDHSNLDKLAVDACKLSEITRDIFPVPFNGRILYFNKNYIHTIPQDMFTNMPNLQTVGLKDNQIAVLPATAFGRTWAKLDYLMLEGNPLICDCRLNWLIWRKPPALSGHCSSPATLKGEQLKDLPDDYMEC